MSLIKKIIVEEYMTPDGKTFSTEELAAAHIKMEEKIGNIQINLEDPFTKILIASLEFDPQLLENEIASNEFTREKILRKFSQIKKIIFSLRLKKKLSDYRYLIIVDRIFDDDSPSYKADHLYLFEEKNEMIPTLLRYTNYHGMQVRIYDLEDEIYWNEKQVNFVEVELL
jgi:hypothetical protein